MRISIDDFKTHIGTKGLHDAGLHAIPRVHGIAAKYYCETLTLRSACSEKCAKCILTLKARLDNTNWQDSRPYALFTFTVKNTAAQMTEKAHEVKPAPANPVRFKADEEKDALDLFMETFE